MKDRVLSCPESRYGDGRQDIRNRTRVGTWYLERQREIWAKHYRSRTSEQRGGNWRKI